MEEAIEKYKGEDKNELIAMLEILRRGERRNLYKSCLQIPYEFASRIALFPYIIGRYREGTDASGNIAKLENELNKAIGKGKNRVLVYCPPTKMQAKEVDTLIYLEEGRIVPLKLHYKHLAISAEVEQLNVRYRGLWKFYVFMHPEDLENSITRSQVITRFCMATGMSTEEAKKVSPYGFDTDEELRHLYLRKWWKERRKWVPAEAFDDIEEIVENSKEWVKCVTQEKAMNTLDCYFQEFDKIFLRTQLGKFLHESQDPYFYRNYQQTTHS